MKKSYTLNIREGKSFNLKKFNLVLFKEKNCLVVFLKEKNPSLYIPDSCPVVFKRRLYFRKRSPCIENCYHKQSFTVLHFGLSLSLAIVASDRGLTDDGEFERL